MPKLPGADKKPIWTLFKKVLPADEQNLHQCLKCEQLIPCTKFSTKGLEIHLEKQHPEVFRDLQLRLRKREQGGSSNLRQLWSEKSVVAPSGRRQSEGSRVQPNPPPPSTSAPLSPRPSFEDESSPSQAESSRSVILSPRPSSEDESSPPHSPTMPPRPMSASSAASSSSSQQKLETYFRKGRLTPHQDRVIDRKVISWIACDHQAFQSVEHPSFRDLIDTLSDGRYSLKSRKYYRETVLPDVVNKMEIAMQSKLDSAEYLSFTTDIWSDVTSNTDLLSLMVTFISEDFELCEYMLAARPLDERHTGEVLAREGNIILEKWQIDPSKVHLVLRDAGANVRKMCRIAEIESEDCLAHKLQCVVRKGLLEQSLVDTVIVSCRRLVTYLKHSRPALKKLHELQTSVGAAAVKPTKDCETRWNSTLHMIERIVKLKPGLGQLATEDRVVGDWLSSDVFTVLAKMIYVLQPFDAATNEISKATALISLVIPVVRTIKVQLTKIRDDERGEGVRSMVTSMIQELEKRFADMETKSHLRLATYLDPRFRGGAFELSGTLSDCRRSLADAEGGTPAPPPLEKRPRVDNDDGASSTGFWAMLELNPDQNEVTIDTNRNDLSPIRKEMELYEKEPKVLPTSDPLLWWRQRSDRFPLLSRYARRFLSAAATSVSSERLFSAAGQILTPQRTCLKPEATEMLLFIKHNISRQSSQYNISTI